MRALISKFLFIVVLIAFYPSAHLQASGTELELSISRITDVEKARLYQPLYKEYHQRVDIDEKEFMNRIGESLSYQDSYYFWGIANREGHPVAFMDGAIFPSTYSNGQVMRLDSVHVFSPILKDLTEEVYKIKFSEITNLFDKVLAEVMEAKNLKKVTSSSGAVYTLEKGIFSQLMSQNDNVVFVRYPK